MKLPKKTALVAKVAGILLAVLLALPLGAWLFLYVGMNGGIKGTISNLKPPLDAGSTAVVAKRDRISNAIEAAFSELETGSDFAGYAVATHDRCNKGENNWKISQGFANRCQFRMTRFYGMKDDVRPQMLGFETRLIESGWTVPPSGIRDFIAHYDENCGRQAPSKFASAAPDCPPSIPPRSYGGYRKNNLQLRAAYADNDSNFPLIFEHTQQIDLDGMPVAYERTDFQNTYMLFQTIRQSYAYALAISIQGTYFEN